jgi:hypothetical protein
MSSSEGIRSTQQLANAAEAFTRTLGAQFPGDTFDQFFHSDTVRRAYWEALQEVLDSYTTPENTSLVKALMDGHVLADPQVVAELLKLFLPGQQPDYPAVARHWAEALNIPLEQPEALARETELLLTALAAELRRSTDLRMALTQLAEMRYAPVGQVEDDLDRLLDVALASGRTAVARQVQHLLDLSAERDSSPPDSDEITLAALIQVVDHLPPDILWQMFERVLHLEYPAVRLKMISQLTPRMSQVGLVPDPLAPIEQILSESSQPLDPAARVHVLLNLAPHLEMRDLNQKMMAFQQRVLTNVESIDDPASRVRALSALVEKLPPHLQNEAIALACETAVSSIPNEYARVAALSALPPRLPPEFHVQLVNIAAAIESPDARALLLGRMLPYLPETLQQPALENALDAIQQISREETRAGALIALGPYLNALGSLQHAPETLQEVIAVIFSIGNDDARARAFAALAPYLSPELLTEALHLLRRIEDDNDRAVTLIRLAPHLPPELSVAAFTIARELQPHEARASALAAVAPYLSATARAEALADALVAALAIPRRYDRVVALDDLAPHLPDDLQPRAMQEALKAARSIPDEIERQQALVFLAPHLLDDLLADALADAYTLTDLLVRVPALTSLMPRLPEEPRARVAQDVLEIARSFDNPQHKASILAAVVPYLPEQFFDDVLGEVDTISTPYDRLHVLIALLPHMPDRLHSAALDAARLVSSPYERASALLEVVPHTPPTLRPAILEEVLLTALKIEDSYDRASALASLAPYVGVQSDEQNRQEDALRLALDACFEIADPVVRADMLAQLAAAWVDLLIPARSYMLWRHVVAYLRQQPYIQVIADLAALRLVLDHMEAPGAADAITDAVMEFVPRG